MAIPRILSVVVLCLFLVAAQLPTAFAADPAKEQAALTAAQAWLTLVDQGKYEDSWKEAASFFKTHVTAETWKQMVGSTRRQAGTLISRSVKSKTYTTYAPGAPPGEYVIIEFNSSFQNKKTAVERVTPMMDKDGKWRVSGYFIR